MIYYKHYHDYLRIMRAFYKSEEYYNSVGSDYELAQATKKYHINCAGEYGLDKQVAETVYHEIKQLEQKHTFFNVGHFGNKNGKLYISEIYVTDLMQTALQRLGYRYLKGVKGYVKNIDNFDFETLEQEWIRIYQELDKIWDLYN